MRHVPVDQAPGVGEAPRGAVVDDGDLRPRSSSAPDRYEPLEPAPPMMRTRAGDSKKGVGEHRLPACFPLSGNTRH